MHTTRSRLVKDQRQPFSLQKEASALIPDFELPEEEKRLRVQLSKEEIQKESDPNELRLQIEGNERDLMDIDYWEADPSFDGKVFRSAAQSVRPISVNGEQSSILVG